MHPPHNSLDDPHYYDEQAYPIVILDLPRLCDEAALQFAELLKDFSEQFTKYYEFQIQQAVYQRSLEERKRLRHEYLAKQKDLFGDDDNSDDTEDDSNTKNDDEEPPFDDDF